MSRVIPICHTTPLGMLNILIDQEKLDSSKCYEPCMTMTLKESKYGCAYRSTSTLNDLFQQHPWLFDSDNVSRVVTKNPTVNANLNTIVITWDFFLSYESHGELKIVLRPDYSDAASESAWLRRSQSETASELTLLRRSQYETAKDNAIIRLIAIVALILAICAILFK